MFDNFNLASFGRVIVREFYIQTNHCLDIELHFI